MTARCDRCAGRASGPHTDTDCMRQITAEMTLLSYGRTQSFNPTGRSRAEKTMGGDPPGGALTGEWRLTGDGFLGDRDVQTDQAAYWWGRFRACESDGQRSRVVDMAAGQLQAIRVGPDAVGDLESEAELRDRIRRTGSGLDVKDAVVAFRCRERTVRDARAEAGLEPETGLRRPVAGPRHCEGCGGDISHRRADAKTCGDACRVRVSVRRRNESDPAERAC